MGLLHTSASVCLTVSGATSPSPGCVSANATDAVGTFGAEVLVNLKPIEVGGEIRGLVGSSGTGMFGALVYWGRVRAEETALTRKAEAIIEFLELEELRHATVGDLSYGLRKRVDLGRAIALDPKILIMDEPMAGMNPEEKGDLARFVLDIRDARIASYLEFFAPRG